MGSCTDAHMECNVQSVGTHIETHIETHIAEYLGRNYQFHPAPPPCYDI